MRYFAIIFFICFSYVTYGQHTDSTLIGRWIGKDEDNVKGGIELLNDGTAKFINRDKEIPINGYEVDYSKDPIWIDLIIRNNGQKRILNGLIQFIDSVSIKLEVFPDNKTKRPTKFSGKSDAKVIILKKQ